MIKNNIDFKEIENIELLHSNYVLQKACKKLENIIKEYRLKHKLLKINGRKNYLNAVERIFKYSLNDIIKKKTTNAIEIEIIDFIKEVLPEKLDEEDTEFFKKSLRQSLRQVNNIESEYRLFLYLKEKGIKKLVLLDKDEIMNFPESFFNNKEFMKLYSLSEKLKYIKILKYYKNTTLKNLGYTKKFNELLEHFKEEVSAFKFNYIKQKDVENIETKTKLNEMIAESIKKFEEQLNHMYKKIEEIFNYDNFVNSYNEWGAYKFVSKLRISVCPYCNRQYITTYISESGKTRPELDHFYVKSIYPYLALTLYNLIPSCHICNSNLKRDKDFVKDKPVYPYAEEFGQDAKFRTSFYLDKDELRKENKEPLTENDRYDVSYLLGNSNNFKIVLEPEDPKSKMGKKIENSIDTFKLEKLYNFHKDYIRELIKKTIIYNESRVDELYTQYPELFGSREELVRTIFSNYLNEEEFGNRPLSKLAKDIFDEFNIQTY